MGTRFGAELVSEAFLYSLYGSVLVALVGGVVAVGITKIRNPPNRHYRFVAGIVWCISAFSGGAALAIVTSTLVLDLSLVVADLTPSNARGLGSGLAALGFLGHCAIVAIPGAFLGGEMGRRRYIRAITHSRQSN